MENLHRCPCVCTIAFCDCKPNECRLTPEKDMKTSVESLIKQVKNNFADNEIPNTTIFEQPKITENTSDGYHTFKELYEYRKVYNAVLFNEWGKHYCSYHYSFPKYDVHKSWKHNDGELCFGGGWFIVVAILPTGQISNHYKAEDWDLFKIPEVEKAKYEFDGHTSQDVINRLLSIN